MDKRLNEHPKKTPTSCEHQTKTSHSINWEWLINHESPVNSCIKLFFFLGLGLKSCSSGDIFIERQVI